MGNCLRTQLKESVQNEMLPTFNYAQIKLHAESPTICTHFNLQNINVIEGQLPNIKLGGDAYFVDKNGNNVGKFIDSQQYTSFITTAEDPTNGQFQGIYVGSDAQLELRYESGGQTLDNSIIDLREINNSEIDLDQLKNVYENSLNYGYNSVWYIAHTIKGNLTSILNRTKGYILVYAPIDGSAVTGSLDNVDRIDDNLKLLQLKNLPNITGNLENFLNAVANHPSSPSGTSTIDVIIADCPLIKYKGEFILSLNQSFIIDCANHTWSEQQ